MLSFGTFMTNRRAPVAVETGVNHGQLVVKNPVCNEESFCEERKSRLDG